MENPSAPEQPSPDPSGRPPALEFAMGVALFALITVAFIIAQSAAFHRGFLKLAPQLADIPFSLEWFEDPAVKEQLELHQYNGDVTASTSLSSGGLCLGLLLLTVVLWKRTRTADFLGLRFPQPMQLLKWFGLFALLMLGIEMLARLSPVFQSDFMKEVVGSTTNMAMLVLGVAVIGPLFEEFLLRGLLYGSLRHIVDEHASVALTAGVFALMHLQYSLPIMLLILPMGIVLGYARARSGSIWVPVMLHMVNNGLSVVWP
ncbi:MAG: CPBP family intramembrane metalloprotease [Flavobacteriales bacterium]|nr:CPBP family intramembrane metalloprotease [Flavobacteriales bacterium]